MILETMLYKRKILNHIKEGLTQKGYTNKTIVGINAQIDVLDDLIKEEGFNVLNELLRKTNYRLLKSIDKGIGSLVTIVNQPSDWYLCNLEDSNEEWLNPESLIFSTERLTLVFTKNKLKNSFSYTNNKWQ